ncbi:MAG: HAMP domain-containing sensor histidine kinase [Candidatus Melainabacteria bacterium]|nr:HAMP domain-containing sensor histidine kinase [Candidatus Melainabacteria bacterium]
MSDTFDQSETILKLRETVEELTEKLASVQKSHSALTLRIQKIITSFPSGLIIVNQDFQIEALNKLAVSFFEYSLDELVRQPLSLLFPEMEKLSINLEPVRTTAVRKSGDSFPAEILVTSLEIKGAERLFVNIQDVTERQRLDQLRADLVSTVSHDIRAPLTSVRLTLDMLSGGHYGTLSERGDKNVETALSSVIYLDSLVKNLLAADTIERGGIQIVPIDTTVGAIVTKSVSTVNCGKEKASVEFDCDYTNDAIRVDEQSVIQVLINLLTNAVKYSPNNSVVRVEAGIEGLEARFKVKDQGPGIQRELQNRIFERYIQLDQHKSVSSHGFGLGLAICKEIVEKHGGRIWVESEPGKGSQFIFTIPFSSD